MCVVVVVVVVVVVGGGGLTAWPAGTRPGIAGHCRSGIVDAVGWLVGTCFLARV